MLPPPGAGPGGGGLIGGGGGGGGIGGGGGAGAAAATTDASLPVPTLLAALQSQLGLRLESKKGSVDILVVDSGDKVPTEN